MILKKQPAVAGSGIPGHARRQSGRFGRCRRFFISGLVLLALLAVTAGAACSDDTNGAGNGDTNDTFSLTDATGKVHEFAAPVDTIISLAPSITEILYAIGAGDNLVGRTDFCNYPAAVFEVDSFGGYPEPSWEMIVAADVDVVLVADLTTDDKVDWLRDHGVRVFKTKPLTFDDVMTDILAISKIAGCDAQAAELVDGLRDRIAQVQTIVATIPADERPKVLNMSWHDPIFTAGQGTYIDAAITMAGGINVFGDLPGHPQVDTEAAVAADPDVITIFTYDITQTSVAYEWVTSADSHFKETQAYLNERTFEIDSDLASRGGPRLVDALEEFARILHPDLFD